MNREQRFTELEREPFTVVDRSPGSKPRSAIKAFKEVLAHQGILRLLIARDLKSRYKDSALGFAWTLIRPITQLVIYAVVIGKFLGAERGIPLFALYIFAGLTIYTLFQETLVGGTGSILANASLVKKVYVPRELFPLAALGTAGFNFLIQMVVLIAATALFGNFHLSVHALYVIPAVLLVITYGLALGLLLSAINVYLRDIGYLVEIAAMVLMWASPILYAWSMVQSTLTNGNLDWLLGIYTNNPITLAVLGFQEAIYGTTRHGLPIPDFLPLRMLIAGIVGLVLLIVTHRLFTRMQGNFAQEL